MSLDDLPEWLQDLPGWEKLSAQVPARLKNAYVRGSDTRYEVRLEGPVDPEKTVADTHPLVSLAGMAFAAARMNDMVTTYVHLCREHDATWTQIGQVLGMTKQAAWERFSGED